MRLVLTPESSEARYVAREVLAGQTQTIEAIGSTRQISGAIVLRSATAIMAEQSKITVDLRDLKSDSGLRDSYLQRFTLNTGQFPNAEFVLTEVKGLPWPLPTSGETAFELNGNLTLRGVTKPATWQVKATFNGPAISGRATTAFAMADFNITTPNVPRVASIESQIRLELDFKATPAAA